jgi:hypothetical protein
MLTIYPFLLVVEPFSLEGDFLDGLINETLLFDFNILSEVMKLFYTGGEARLFMER